MPHVLRHQNTDQLRSALTGGNFLGGTGPFGAPSDIGPGLPLPRQDPRNQPINPWEKVQYPLSPRFQEALDRFRAIQPAPMPPIRRTLPYTGGEPQIRNLPFTGGDAPLPRVNLPMATRTPPSYSDLGVNLNRQKSGITDRTVTSRTRGGHSDIAKQSGGQSVGRATGPSTSTVTRFKRKAGATDVAGTAKRKPTTRGKGRKTVVKGTPAQPRRKPPAAQQRAIKTGQAGRTARARRKSAL